MPWDAMLVMVNPLDGGRVGPWTVIEVGGGGGVAPSPGEAFSLPLLLGHPRRTYKTYKTLHVHCP
jgi:hypothetical protein